MATFYQTPSQQIDVFADLSFNEAISQLGDPLQHLEKSIDFEIFRKTIEDTLKEHKSKKGRQSKAGRPPKDPVFMFRVLFLQRLFGLSDAQTEFLINERMSFRRFLGISHADEVPDRNTVWRYRELFTELGLMEKLFDLFHSILLDKGLIMQEGKVVDASFVEARCQRNSREENQKIKDGEGEELWNDKPRKKCQKDVDARWTKKNNETHYGYKAHVKADVKSKLIDRVVTTTASVHDSQVIDLFWTNTTKDKPFTLIVVTLAKSKKRSSQTTV